VELIARGRGADVFVVDEVRVLRRCRDPRTRCEAEAATMEWVRSQGYPAPRVHSVDGPDMVLDRVQGPTMVESLLAGTTTIDAAGRILAELLRQLHALTPIFAERCLPDLGVRPAVLVAWRGVWMRCVVGD
jgi:aminoglycoside phosphotransferase